MSGQSRAALIAHDEHLQAAYALLPEPLAANLRASREALGQALANDTRTIGVQEARLVNLERAVAHYRTTGASRPPELDQPEPDARGGLVDPKSAPGGIL